MLTFEYRNLLHSELIPTAIPESYIHNYAHACKQANEEIKSDRQAGILGFYDLPDQDISHILNFMESLDPKYNTMVVLGIGGSALGNKALYSALKTERNLDKKLFVYDNVDPVFLSEILDQINLDTTIFNVISKSGTTAETMAAYLIIADLIKKRYPNDYQERFIITTDKEKGFLRKLCEKEHYPSFVVPDNVGGRFSVLSDVGLVSSAFTNINIQKLLQGAASMRERCADLSNIYDNPAYLNGLLHYLYFREGLS